MQLLYFQLRFINYLLKQHKMKLFNQTTLIILAMIFPYLGFAQETEDAPADTAWNVNGLISINFSQSSFSNWAAGGDNNVGLSVFYKPNFIYNKGKISWENNLDFRYGKNKVGNSPWRKSDDLLELNSKLGIKNGKFWYYTAVANFRTQFDKGFTGQEATYYVSKFMAPGYLSFTIGMDYKPNDKFSLLISPLTSRTTFVLDDSLSNKGEYGVTPGEKSFSQFGPNLVLKYKNEVFENVVVDTKISSLYQYSSDAKFVFNWDFILGLKVNKFLTTTLTTAMIYDENILFDVVEGGNVVGKEKRLQFKEVLAIGVTFSY